MCQVTAESQLYTSSNDDLQFLRTRQSTWKISKTQFFSGLTWSNWGSSPLCSDLDNGFSWNHTMVIHLTIIHLYFIFFNKNMGFLNFLLKFVTSSAVSQFFWTGTHCSPKKHSSACCLAIARSHTAQETAHSWQLPLLQSSIIWDKSIQEGFRLSLLFSW